MAILNYTTTIDCEKTISEIMKCLVNHGATKIVIDYDGSTPSAVTFCLMLNGETEYRSLYDPFADMGNPEELYLEDE